MTGSPASFTKNFLDVSRPAVEAGLAVVHHGISVVPKVGSGESRYWRAKEEGWWEATGEIFSRWIS